MTEPRLADIKAGHATLLGLARLVAVDRIIKEVGKVVKQRQARLHHIGIGLKQRIAAALAHGGRQAVTRGLAAVGGIDGAERIDLATLHRAQRNLIAGVPGALVEHAGHAELVIAGALRITQHAQDFVEGFRRHPRAVVVAQLRTVHQIAGAQRRRTSDHGTVVLVLAHRHAGAIVMQLVRQRHVRRAGGGEVAFIRVVRAFLVVDAVHQLGDQKVQVRIALAVRVGAHVDRHAVNEGGEVGAVIQIEAAQEVLIGLAVAAVLRDDHAGHKFQQLAGPQRRTAGDQFCRHRDLAGGVRGADAVIVVAAHLDCVVGGVSRILGVDGQRQNSRQRDYRFVNH